MLDSMLKKRKRQSFIDSNLEKNPNSEKFVRKKSPKRLGLYKEGKSVLEKVVKETFKPEVNEGLKKHIKKIPKEDTRFDGQEKKLDEVIEDIPKVEEEPGGGVFVPEDTSEDFGKGAVIHQSVVNEQKKKQDKENG